MDIFQRLRTDPEFRLDEIPDINAVDSNGMNLLQTAISRRPDLVEGLLDKGVDVDHQDKDGYTALHYALERANSPMAARILAKKSNVNLINKHGNGPLWAAVMKFKSGTGIVETLIAMGADKHHKNNVG